MHKHLFPVLVILLAAALAAAAPITLYRIDLRPGTDAYRFAAENAIPAHYAGNSCLLTGGLVDRRHFPQIAGISLIFAGDAKDLRWVHARRGASPDDAGLPALFSDNGAMLVRAPRQDKDVDRSRFRLSGFNAAPVMLPRNPMGINPGLARDTTIAQLAQQITIANFQATDSALQAFNTRSVIAPNHQDVTNWIRDQLLSFGIADVKIDSFVDPGFTDYVRLNYGVTDSAKIRNVIATIPGLADTHTVYVVGGHYDTSVWPYNPWAPGADDNGSGTAAAIEMARVFASNPPNCTVKFVAFDNEEWGLYGSEKFAADAVSSGMKIGCMLNFDMVASTGNDSIFVSKVHPGSEDYARLLGQSATWYARTADTNLVATYNNVYLNGSDSWNFYTRGFHVTYNEESNFSPVYHQTNDSTTYMNMRYGTSQVRAGIGLLATMANYPQPVRGLAVTDVGDGARLLVDWQPNTATNVTGYLLHWGRDSLAWTDSVMIAAPSDTIAGLMADSLYYIGVVAVDNVGRFSPLVAIASGTPRSVPLTPQNVAATPAAGGIRVDWRKNTELDLAGYALYRRIDSGPSDSLTAVTDSTYLDQPLSGAGKYYYRVQAYDRDGNRSAPSAEAYGRPFTFDQGILIVDETYNWTTGNYPRDTTQDKFYHAILGGYRVTDWEFDSAQHKPALADFAPYSTVLWHGDDRTDLLAAGDTAGLRTYLANGGRLWMVGWQPLGDVRNGATYPATFAAGSFIHDWLKVSQAGLSTTSDTFLAARGAAGYPDVTVDSAKVPLASWKGTMRYIESLTPVSPAEAVYTIDMKNNGSPFEGLTCGIRYLGTDYKLVYCGYPLYFMKQGEARALAVQVMSDFGETGVTGRPGATAAPYTTRLESGRPNPFTRTTTISYQLAKAGRVELSVYNIAGQRVRTLVDGHTTIGTHAVTWDGRNEAGRDLAAGVYLVRMSTDGTSRTAKVTLLR